MTCYLICEEIHIVTRYNLEMRGFPYRNDHCPKVLEEVACQGGNMLSLWVKGAHHSRLPFLECRTWKLPLALCLIFCHCPVGFSDSSVLIFLQCKPVVSVPAPSTRGQTCPHSLCPHTWGKSPYTVMLHLMAFSFLFLYLRYIPSCAIQWESSDRWHSSVSCFSGICIIL